MTFAAYWPTVEEIDYCIRTEAEESAEHVLLSAHEPMILRRKRPNDSIGDIKNELDLLDHFLNVERPIPIIGPSGIGKSHLIRWLDAKLKVHLQAKNWKITRIPKNVSLAQVLELLLEGLEGEEFETARTKIHRVEGKNLKPIEIADYLIVSISQSLNNLYNKENENAKIIYKETGSVSTNLKNRLKILKRHAQRNALPSLLGDRAYQIKLIEDGKCLNQIAKRILQGSNNQEIFESDYELKLDDLEFSDIHLGDLSQPTKTYINNSSINTMEERKQEAIDLVNEVLNDSIRETFQHIFEFHSGTFQELFTLIRKNLHEQDKTLVVLIEDMAQISAIEDVLLDSLTLEGMRDGETALCPVRTAIAVTSGYQGYQRRRDTLATRAGFEWFIEDFNENDEETYNRIEDFCGRYLNTARLGHDYLKATYKPEEDDLNWPKIFFDDDQDVNNIIESFGFSKSGHQLFPFNNPSIRLLADQYCIKNGKLEFNPRIILREILINVLKPFRHSFLVNEFPPDNFLNIDPPGNLAREIHANIHENLEKANSIVAIWGYGSDDLEHLAGILSPNIANAFGCEELVSLLNNTTPIKPVIDKPIKPIKPIPGTVTKETEDVYKNISKEVDNWFSNKNIPQKEANIIRKQLSEEIGLFWKGNYQKWFGMKTFPELISGKNKAPLINIPYNTTNPVKTYAQIGSEKEFSKNPLLYKTFLTALLRFNVEKNWEFPGGYEDYCFYTEFLSTFLPSIVNDIANNYRAEFISNNKNLIINQLNEACVFKPNIHSLTLSEKVNHLCQSKEDLEKKYPITGIDNWDNHRKTILDLWDGNKEKWLKYFSTNSHAMDGDVVQSLLRGSSDVDIPFKTGKIANEIQSNLQKKYISFGLLKGCTDKKSFVETLTSLNELIRSLNSENQYINDSAGLTARKLINRITTVLEEDIWNHIKTVTNLFEPFEAKSTIEAINSINIEKADKLDEILSNWSTVYSLIKANLEDQSSRLGGDKRLELKGLIDLSLNEIEDKFSSIQEYKS